MKVVSSDVGLFHMQVSCVVRNELNGWRKPHEVVYGITKDNKETNIPVMPRVLPKGLWHVVFIEPRSNPYQSPFVIMTDAHQELDVWSLDENGNYLEPTGEKFDDWMYGIHLSCSNTTLGCIKAHSDRYFGMLMDVCAKAIDRKEPCILEVQY